MTPTSGLSDDGKPCVAKSDNPTKGTGPADYVKLFRRPVGGFDVQAHPGWGLWRNSHRQLSDLAAVKLKERHSGETV